MGSLWFSGRASVIQEAAPVSSPASARPLAELGEGVSQCRCLQPHPFPLSRHTPLVHKGPWRGLSSGTWRQSLGQDLAVLLGSAWRAHSPDPQVGTSSVWEKGELVEESEPAGAPACSLVPLMKAWFSKPELSWGDSSVCLPPTPAIVEEGRN